MERIKDPEWCRCWDASVKGIPIIPMGQWIMKAILEVVAGSVLKWGELAHVLLAIDKEFDTKVGLEDVTVRCTGERGAQTVPRENHRACQYWGIWSIWVKKIQRFDAVWYGRRYGERWKGCGEPRICFLSKVIILTSIGDTVLHFVEVPLKEWIKM
jgi:hypothetical protein